MPAEKWTEAYHQSQVAQDYDLRYHGPIRRMNNRQVERAVVAALTECAGGSMPVRVFDLPAGTGRFTAAIRAAGAQVCHLDASAEMLKVCRSKHDPGWEVVGDLFTPPLALQEDACILSLRLMQHYGRDQRIAALRAFRQIAPRAVVAYYPGWDWKNRFRHLRASLGLPTRKLREAIPRKQLAAEAAQAGWKLVRARQVFPVLSENVLLILHAN
ncbi:MAG: class I SAM-dependent methyltransferase [Planctomycetes bacterium]|nr:class I SAM-dependent methyltransferase [Planctomycetota bacterium]